MLLQFLVWPHIFISEQKCIVAGTSPSNPSFTIPFRYIIKPTKILLTYLNVKLHTFIQTQQTPSLFVIYIQLAKKRKQDDLPWECHLERVERCWPWCWCLCPFGPVCCTHIHGCCRSSLGSLETKELPHCSRLWIHTPLQEKQTNTKSVEQNQFNDNLLCKWDQLNIA